MQRKLLIGFVVICALFSIFIVVKYMYNLNSEVGEAFAVMNERIEGSNASTSHKVDSLKTVLLNSENIELKQKVITIDSVSSDLDATIQLIKEDLMKSLSYEDASTNKGIDMLFDNDSKRGEELVASMNSYRNTLLNLLKSDDPELIANLNSKFQTKPTVLQDGTSESWLDYHFKGYPMIAVLTKLTQIQADIQSVKLDVFTSYLN